MAIISSGSGWSTSSSGTPITQPFQPAPTPMTAPDNSAMRQQLVDVIGTTTAAYNKLMQGGRENDAFALADALRAYTRTGTKLGVNSWARQEAINQLRARMSSAALIFQGTTMANALAAQTDQLGRIAALDQQTFKNAMEANNQNFNQRNTTAGTNLDIAKYNSGENRAAAWNQQQKALSEANTSSADADARIRAMQTPLATPKTGAEFAPQSATPFQGSWQNIGTTTQPNWQAYGTGTKNAGRVVPTRSYNWGM